MASREGSHGIVFWRQSQKSKRWGLTVRGDVGTELVVELLLSEDDEDNPGQYTHEMKQGLANGLGKRWRELERFFTDGGVVNKRGIFVPFNRQEPRPGTNLATYRRERTTVADLPKGRQEEYKTVGFIPREAIYMAGLNLYRRLQAIPKPGIGYNIELDSEPWGWEFLKGARTGFENRFRTKLPYFGLDHRILPIDTAVDQKLYDLAMRARREVVLEQALRS